MSHKHWLCCVIASLLPALASAASVTGQFQLEGKPALKPGEVAAFRSRNQNNPREFDTFVMLTSQAVNKDNIGKSLDPYTVAINDPATLHADYLTLWVRNDGTVSLNASVGGTQFIDTSGKMMGQQGDLSATCKDNTPTHVSCMVKTTQPVKSMNGPAWSMDIAFDADVIARAGGKPMAKDGGEPGKALLALRAAVAGNDFGKILALLTPEMAKSYNPSYGTPEDNLKSAKDILDARLPKKPKVTGGEWLADDRALLEVEGAPFESMRMLYLVEMHRIDGKWLWADATAAGILH